MSVLEISFRPMAPGWLVGAGAAVLLVLVIFFLVRRPGERWGWTVRALMLLALVGILVRPGYGEVKSSAKTADLEILVVVDRTTSMSALDWNGDQRRLDGVRTDMKELTRAFPGARFSLMTFGRFVRTELPFSSDSGAFLAAVDTIQREDIYDGTGSVVDAPLKDMETVLTKAAERNPDRKRIVVFVSDGENTAEGETQDSFEPLDEVVDAGIVLGYGTEAGGKMLRYEDPDYASDSYVHDENYDDALSRLDQENLEKVASEMGVDYQHREEPGGLDTWADGIDHDFTPDDDDVVAQHEVYWMFALGLFGLALVELAIGWRGFHQARREMKGLR
ncbi:VWA domain-containing protein [Nocardioides sp. JQ2195]|uniref:vWA domain-containing protein n=1 Tax=Nocardioides sp. JQ2195 TaxID=2592334 RepID=UPI00143E34AC|nr:vWA domain-containing protein [Nocardioides sp. JQ2195]QIX26242.1 VWA domain-containing protein [Nocardioides sp. JQ2195]